jgi:nucleosome binding factor SPN SPT16 subunit
MIIALDIFKFFAGLTAPFLLSEDDEETSGSVPDTAIHSGKKKDEGGEDKETDPTQILEEDMTGFPRAEEKAEDPEEKDTQRMEKAF